MIANKSEKNTKQKTAKYMEPLINEKIANIVITNRTMSPLLVNLYSPIMPSIHKALSDIIVHHYHCFFYLNRRILRTMALLYPLPIGYTNIKSTFEVTVCFYK